MMRVLIVRLSSMGDLVQTLPALTDAARARPDIRFDWVVDESFAQFAYQHKYAVSKQQHSIQRMRELLARVLGYSYAADEIDYGIDRARLGALALELPEPFVGFIHSTSWTSKNWPEAYWQDLTAK